MLSSLKFRSPLMNAASRILLLSLAATGWAMADLPKKAPISKYTGLWTNSPFTSKPPPAADAPETNPLEDYALAGVSPIGSGYRVTLLNKKKPEERIFVFSDDGGAKHGFKILGVTRKSGDPLGTVVRMASGSLIGTVAYDEKSLTLAAPKVQPQAAQPGAPPVPGQPQPQPGQPQRQPRPRVVPPPTPQGQPQVQQPQVQQAQQVQPAQNNANRRPDRRGR